MKRLLVVLVMAWACCAYASSPTIVASKKFLSQTSDVPSTAIFTPTAAGTFRITMCAIDATHNGGIGLHTTYTDVEGSAEEQDLQAGGPTQPCASAEFVANPDAISFFTSGITGSGFTYNVYVVLEKLQ